VKAHATGKGNASKDAMVLAAATRWGVTATEDEADALWIADALRREVGL
jgi:Holliday junction resolvasome RuvABC endonuclease subunit